jgi:hypothetical protein
MARALHVRLDADSEAALTVLREEARRLGANPADRAELAALRDELDRLAPPWPSD